MDETLPRRTLRQALTTLVLLLSGIVALGLALFVWGVFSVCWGESRRARAEFDLTSLQSALRLYQRKTGQLPTHDEGLQLLVAHGVLDELPLDPWVNPYQYTLRGDQVELRSLGSDGVGGGEGNEQDIELTFPVSPTDQPAVPRRESTRPAPDGRPASTGPRSTTPMSPPART